MYIRLLILCPLSGTLTATTIPERGLSIYNRRIIREAFILRIHPLSADGGDKVAQGKAWVLLFHKVLAHKEAVETVFPELYYRGGVADA